MRQAAHNDFNDWIRYFFVLPLLREQANPPASTGGDHHSRNESNVNDKEIEQEIITKGKIAPRVTPDRIEQVITKAEYHRLTPVLTVCVLTLANGFTVTGESACASPENFDEEIGNKIARENAKQKIWPLEGYLLRQILRDEERNPRRYGNLRWINPEDLQVAIARVCHEVNCAYCQALGDNSQPAWEDAPQWQKDSALLGVQLHMWGDHGPEASHESWMAQKLADGWKYGPVKNPEAKEHPCIVPFGELPKEQQAKDFIFRAVVHALGR